MLKLYDYWRSSSAYRVRIALNLKGLSYQRLPVSLIDNEQHGESYRALNPQGLVPLLVDGEKRIAQSTAILEYLEETTEGDSLLPGTPAERARIREMANIVACDTQPLNNLRVLQYLTRELAVDDHSKSAWYQHWVDQSFIAIEQKLDRNDAFACGDVPTLADCYLIPQVYNAIRYNVNLEPYPKLQSLYRRCNRLPAFQAAAPEANKPT